MNRLTLFVLVGSFCFGQSVANTGPTNLTPTAGTVSQTFTAAGSAPVAAISFEIPATMSTLTIGTAALAANKALLCSNFVVNGVRPCIIYGFNDLPIGAGVLSSATVTSSGAYQLSKVEAASPTATSVLVTLGAPLQVTLPSRCDIDRNGTVNQADQDLLAQYWVGNLAIPVGVEVDIDKNGNFTNGDVQRLGRIARGVETCPQ